MNIYSSSPTDIYLFIYLVIRSIFVVLLSCFLLLRVASSFRLSCGFDRIRLIRLLYLYYYTSIFHTAEPLKTIGELCGYTMYSIQTIVLTMPSNYRPLYDNSSALLVASNYYQSQPQASWDLSSGLLGASQPGQHIYYFYYTTRYSNFITDSMYNQMCEWVVKMPECIATYVCVCV